jgi:hypothetical protein
VLAAAGVVALAGCGSHPRPQPPAQTATPTPRPPTDRERITKLLDGRAQALEAGRPHEFATSSLPKRRSAARESASRAARLGLRQVKYEVGRIEVNHDRARIHSRLSYEIKGVSGDFGSQRTLIARRKRGSWRLDRALGSRDAEPWEVDDYTRVTTPHFVVLTPTDIAAPADALETGYARLREALHNAHLKRRYLAVVARDGEYARRLTRRIAGLENLTALTDTQLGAGTEIASQRLILVQSAFGIATAEDQQTVVTHELTHAVLARFATGRTPAWLIEGVALYVSGDDRRFEYAQLPTVPTIAALSTPDAIARLSGDLQRGAYAASSAVAFLIADTYGRDALLRLYRAFAEPGPRRGGMRYSDRVLHHVLGTSLDELQNTLG